VAYVTSTGQFNPSTVVFADLSAEQEQILGGVVNITQVTGCIDSTNPACGDVSDFRGTSGL